jgi:hypothetical protein
MRRNPVRIAVLPFLFLAIGSVFIWTPGNGTGLKSFFPIVFALPLLLLIPRRGKSKKW